MQHLDKCVALTLGKWVNYLFNVNVLVFWQQQGEAEAEKWLSSHTGISQSQQRVQARTKHQHCCQIFHTKKSLVVDASLLCVTPHDYWFRFDQEVINGQEQIKTHGKTMLRETQEAKSIIEPNKRQGHRVRHQRSECTAAIMCGLNKDLKIQQVQAETVCQMNIFSDFTNWKVQGRIAK